jgi:Ca2+-binding EF-hand superfamily protein
MAAVAAAHAALRRKKQKQLNQKYDAFRKQQNKSLDLWFKKFDINHDQALQRNELLELLKLFQPNVEPPDDQMLDYLMGVSEKIDGDASSVKRESLSKVMMVYRDYAKDKDKIDAVFDKYDKDKTGFLNRSELLGLLKSFHEDDPEIYPEPEENDSEFILNRIISANDKAHSPEGTLAKDEILPAIATWKSLSNELMKQKSKTCAVM